MYHYIHRRRSLERQSELARRSSPFRSNTHEESQVSAAAAAALAIALHVEPVSQSLVGRRSHHRLIHPIGEKKITLKCSKDRWREVGLVKGGLLGDLHLHLCFIFCLLDVTFLFVLVKRGERGCQGGVPIPGRHSSVPFIMSEFLHLKHQRTFQARGMM